MSTPGRTLRTGGVPRSRDSGLARDYNDQRTDLHALQEALDASNEDVDKYRNRTMVLDAELSTMRKKGREQEATIRGLINENSTLKEQRITLQEENGRLRDENLNLRQQIAPSESGYLMTSGSGESLDSLKRSKSKKYSAKQEGEDMTNRIRERINKPTVESDPSTMTPLKDGDKKKEHRRSESRSRKPRPEEFTTDRPHRDRKKPPVTTWSIEQLENYTTASETSSTLPFRPGSAASRSRNAPATGDYTFQPLPQHNQRGRRLP